MLVLVAAALAQELSLEDTLGKLTYEGGLNATDSTYVVGRPVTVSHAGGNIAVRCMDTERLSARVEYTVYGTSERNMETFGKGIGLAAGGGVVKTRTPSRGSGVDAAEIPLTVNVPRGTSTLTVSQSGNGWVQVTGCTGKVTVSAGRGGAYVGGAPGSVTVTAAGGDVKLEMEGDAVLTGSTTVSAPGGGATVILGSAQGGKLTAKGSEVTVGPVVMGSVTPTFVQGEMGVSGPAITISAKGRVEVR